jgi:uncharacterized NAD-dependent epimerase/dehydratase family protein
MRVTARLQVPITSELLPYLVACHEVRELQDFVESVPRDVGMIKAALETGEIHEPLRSEVAKALTPLENVVNLLLASNIDELVNKLECHRFR